MSDDEKNKPETLAYWNAKDRPPTPTAVLVLSFAGGLLTSMVAVIVVGGFCFVGGMNSTSSSPNPRLVAGIMTAFWLGLISVCFVWATRKVREGRNLSLEWRREPRRFFVLGILIGCGIAGLIEGLCFGAQTFS